MIKPDPRVFELMIKRLVVPKEETLMAGDSLEDDVKAAEQCGIKGVLIDRKGKHPKYPLRIISLGQLKRFIQ